MQDDEAESKRGAWKTKAQIEGWECIRCGNYPEYEEREQYFESKLCGWCLHQTLKDD